MGRHDEMSDPLISKILLATDGSKDAELAATTAVGLAKITGSELHDVYVGHMPGVLYAAFSSVHHGAIHRGSSC